MYNKYYQLILDGHEERIVHPKIIPIRYTLKDLNDFREVNLFSVSGQNPLLSREWWQIEFDSKIIGIGLSGLLALAFRGRYDTDVIAINPFIDILGKYSNRMRCKRKNFSDTELIYMLHGDNNILTTLEDWYLRGRMLGAQNVEIFWSRDCNRVNTEIVRGYFLTFALTRFYSSFNILKKEVVKEIQKGE